MKHSAYALTFMLTCAAFAAGCSETITTHGHILKDTQLQNIQVGKDDKNTVLQTLGTPSTVSTFNDNRWYYITEVTASKPLSPNNVLERRVVIISFNPNGTVSEVETKTDEGSNANVGFNEKQTPTHGQKLGLIDHLLQGLKF